MSSFKLQAPFKPAGSQPAAITELLNAFNTGTASQTLLGVTGSGKTFTMANLISALNRPTLVIAHNKTLAAQLYQEFRAFFPENGVEYFVSYYDYYQPESYLPQRDLYIEKDAQINDKLEQMRLSATTSLLSRPDVIVVASVSCIYGLGNPGHFRELGFAVRRGQEIGRQDFLLRLVNIQYERNDYELLSGHFRVRGGAVDLFPVNASAPIRFELFGDRVERIYEPAGGRELDSYLVFPARHFVTPPETREQALTAIEAELESVLPGLGPLEAQRLGQRTRYDLEMIRETGHCKGIENYSRHFDGRRPGEKPYCLLDYFPDDFLLIIDESHQTLPQLRAMQAGDRSRKENLVNFGFRLPSAFDNRPLTFAEFSAYMKLVLFVSATPGNYELKESGRVVEQIIRPTGLLDPPVEVRPAAGQVADLEKEIRRTLAAGDRVLVTTLTKKLAEELTLYLSGRRIKTRYLHSEINTLERSEIIRDLRLGVFDVLVGINLLREGLDLPEVGFIAILDADKEGFLRDERSLIQTIGRAARNSRSRVIFYAEGITESMSRAISETNRRRSIQQDFNQKHGIRPRAVSKSVAAAVAARPQSAIKKEKTAGREIKKRLLEMEIEMTRAAEALDFERAIELRDEILRLQGDHFPGKKK